jgi:hypothetical protein
MINRTQNKIYSIGSNQNKRIMIPQNKQMNLMNQISKAPNNSQKKPFTANANLNNRNIGNNNQIPNKNSNFINNNENDELNKALLIIRRELKKKDDKILELEKRVLELTNKLNLLTNNKGNNFNNKTNITPLKNSLKGEYNTEEDDYKIGRDSRAGGLGIEYASLNNIINLRKNNIRGNNYMRSISQNNPNYNSDNENMVRRYPGYDNLSHSNDNSVLTYNGVQASSKKDVKNYLKEVKSKIEPKKFKEFIRNIKLLTAKNNSALNKNVIVESVRILFGDEHKDLFIRFENIIGVGK